MTTKKEEFVLKNANPIKVVLKLRNTDEDASYNSVELVASTDGEEAILLVLDSEGIMRLEDIPDSFGFKLDKLGRVILDE